VKAVDKFLLLFSLIIAGAGIGLLNHTYLIERHFAFSSLKLRPLGEVVSATGGSKRKSEMDLVWASARGREKAFEYDSFYTGINDELTIELKDGGRIQLGPNTLVRLQSSKAETVLELKSGTTEINLGDNGKLNVIGTKKKYSVRGAPNSEVKIQAKTASIQIITKNKPIQLESVSGEAVRLEKNEALLDQGETLKEAQVTKVKSQAAILPPTLLYPLNSVIYLEGETSAGVVLRWQNSNSSQDSRIQVLKAGVSNDMVIDQWVAGKEYATVELPVGDYFWRIVARSPPLRGSKKIRSVPSETAKFTIVRQPEPVMVNAEPEPQEIIPPLVESTPESILLVEKKLKQLLLYINLDNRRLKLSNPPIMSWVPSYLDSNSKTTDISSESTVSSVSERKKAEFESQYTLNIYLDSALKQKIFTRKITGTSYSWLAATPGHYYWRVGVNLVRQRDPAAKNSKVLGTPSVDPVSSSSGMIWSEVGEMELSLPAPQWTEVNSTERIQVNDKGLLVNTSLPFSADWEQVPGAKEYIVLLSQEEEFAGAKSRIVKSSRVQFQPNSEGVFYMKVAAMAPARQLASNYSEVRKVEVSKSVFREIEAEKSKIHLSAPILSSPPHRSKIVDFSGKESRVVVFSWDKTEKAEEYELVLSQDPNFDGSNGNVEVHRVEDTGLAVEINTSGEYHWRVRARAKGADDSPWSKPRSIKIQM
jgi:hypothetical protein